MWSRPCCGRWEGYWGPLESQGADLRAAAESRRWLVAFQDVQAHAWCVTLAASAGWPPSPRSRGGSAGRLPWPRGSVRPGRGHLDLRQGAAPAHGKEPYVDAVTPAQVARADQPAVL